MKRIVCVVDAAARAGAFLGGIAIGLMMVHVALDVMSRKLLGHPLPGTLTAVTFYYMIIAVFLPLALVERRGGHIAADFPMPQSLSRLRGCMRAIGGVMAALIMALVAWCGGVDAVRDWQVNASQVQGSLIIPVWPARFAVPLGAGLLALVFLWRLVPRRSGP